ncbi:MAG: YbjQ family protein [Methanosphaera stadtmanae]|nr:YbjQ family protein [Methanosphaera stadtmanae]
MFENEKVNKDRILLAISIMSGLLIGMLITWFCIKHKLLIYGVNINIFIAPIVAGFVETIVSNYTRNNSSGAISAIILFFVTNGIGWLFPSNPLTFNIFTVGGFLLMLQAAFPLIINYLLIGLYFLITYLFGLLGSFIVFKIFKNEESHVHVTDLEDVDDFKVMMFNSKPNYPINEYHGLVFSEDVIDFDEKNHLERLEYIGATIENKSLLKHQDYAIARRYILHNLEKEALKLNANAIVELQFEYTNYNQQIPPDVVVAAYGTAVTIDEKFL